MNVLVFLSIFYCVLYAFAQLMAHYFYLWLYARFSNRHLGEKRVQNTFPKKKRTENIIKICIQSKKNFGIIRFSYLDFS